MTVLPERHLVSQSGPQVTVSDKHVAYISQIIFHLALKGMNLVQKTFLNLFEKSFFLKSMKVGQGRGKSDSKRSIILY